MAETVETRWKTQKKTRSKAFLIKTSQTWRKKCSKDENLEMTSAKFKCTRERVLGHDWLIEIS